MLQKIDKWLVKLEIKLAYRVVRNYQTGVMGHHKFHFFKEIISSIILIFNNSADWMKTKNKNKWVQVSPKFWTNFKIIIIIKEHQI